MVEHHWETVAARDKVLAETINIGRNRRCYCRVHLKNTRKRSRKLPPIDREDGNIIGQERQRIASPRKIAADRDDPTTMMMHDLAWTPVAAGARTPDLLDDPAGPTQQRFSHRPLVLESSLPLQPIRGQSGDCFERRPQAPKPPHPPHP
jgi:hypothetical protein